MEKIRTPLFLENFENLTPPLFWKGVGRRGEGVSQLCFYPRKMQGWGLKSSRCFSWSCKVILSEYIGGNNSLEGRTSWFIELGGRFLKLIVKVIYWIEKSNGFRNFASSKECLSILLLTVLFVLIHSISGMSYIFLPCAEKGFKNNKTRLSQLFNFLNTVWRTRKVSYCF